MDIETLQLILEMGPEAAAAVKVYILANALSGTAFVVSVFGTLWWGLKGITRSFMFEELSRKQKQEYLARKFKVSQSDEETPASDI